MFKLFTFITLSKEKEEFPDNSLSISSDIPSFLFSSFFNSLLILFSSFFELSSFADIFASFLASFSFL